MSQPDQQQDYKPTSPEAKNFVDFARKIVNVPKAEADAVAAEKAQRKHKKDKAA